MIAPMSQIRKRRANRTLHGRSIPRPGDVPGHNVFKGWGTWARNGHQGVGDGVDLFCPARTPVVACWDGVQTRHDNDDTRLNVIYLERADGAVAVYAHIEEVTAGTGHRFAAGDVIGYVRGDLRDPHLHFELWLDGQAVTAPSGAKLRDKIATICGIK